MSVRSGDERGASLLLAMGVVTLLGVFATTTLAFVGVGGRQGAASEARTEQLYAADAGVEYGIRALSADASVCAEGGASHTWPTMAFNGRTVTYRCEWVSGTGEDGDPRTARIVSTATGPGDVEITTAAAIVRPAGTPAVLAWEVHGEWQSPGPSTTTTTAPPPTTTTTAPTTSTTVPGVASFPRTLWLKTSAPGDVASSPLLPLRPAAPTSMVLPNYDADRDSASGLTIQRGPAKADEQKAERHQRWALPVGVPTRLTGDVRLELYSALVDGSRARGSMAVFLASCDPGGTCTTIASAEEERQRWEASPDGWVVSTLDFGRIDHTVAAGHQLSLVVTVHNRSDDHMRVAYDTVGQPSRLIIE